MAFLPADILERLRRAHAGGRLPHAMLISGSAGSGRAELAMSIAGMVNEMDATGAASHPDVHKLEPESKSRRILIEPFRQFCAPFFSTSFRPGATKTGIILEADRLHPNAANAFLKTLEEPPANTLFILVTSNPGQLPVTIVSRCAHFPLRDAGLPALEGPAAEIADATGELLSSAPSSRTGAALRLARRLQRLLREARENVEDELSAAFKAEKKRLGDEARVLATRQHLAGVVAERTADVLRARHGVASLQFPALEAESRRLAAQFDDAELLRVLDGAARLRLFLDRNLKEDLALEAGCLALVRS
jgi:DNA polymerase-3 subunit delta'